MANINISPFGQNATMPAGYPIADNLTTNSAQQALSAKQGVKLKELCGISTSIVINALGDSITHGWCGPGDGDFTNPTWVQQLASNLGCTVNNYGAGNTGICPNGTYEPFVTRLSRMTETNIDMLLIFGGVNDYNNRKAHSIGQITDTPALGDNFIASFKNLIETAINKYPTAVIAVITPLRTDHNTPNTYGITLEDIVNAEIEVAEYYGVPVYDFFHNGTINPEFNAYKTRYTTDGLHPNQAGVNKFLVPQITNYVRDLLVFKAAVQP